MAVEKALSRCEGKWSAALRSVIRDESLPSGDALADLLAFVAFMAVRVPRIRSAISDFIDRTSKAELRATFSSREGREHFRRVLADQGEELDDADLAGLAEFVESDAYEVSFDRTWDVQTMIGLAIRLLLVLGRRWSLWVAAEDAPDLFCSDGPVSLTWLTRVVGSIRPASACRIPSSRCRSAGDWCWPPASSPAGEPDHRHPGGDRDQFQDGRARHPTVPGRARLGLADGGRQAGEHFWTDHGLRSRTARIRCRVTRGRRQGRQARRLPGGRTRRCPA